MATQKQMNLFSSAARTATPTPVVFYNDGFTGVRVDINVTAVTSTPSTTFLLEASVDNGSTYFTLATSSAVATVSRVSLQVDPRATVVASSGTGQVASAVLPKRLRLTATHGNANSMTYRADATFTD
jgi:hypothetical protein